MASLFGECFGSNTWAHEPYCSTINKTRQLLAQLVTMTMLLACLMKFDMQWHLSHPKSFSQRICVQAAFDPFLTIFIAEGMSHPWVDSWWNITNGVELRHRISMCGPRDPFESSPFRIIQTQPLAQEPGSVQDSVSQCVFALVSQYLRQSRGTCLEFGQSIH